VLGIAGFAIEMIAGSEEGAETASEEARLFRLNRVFRILRILRLFRLFHLLQIVRAKLANENLSLQLAEHLKTLLLCRAFISAHVSSQIDMQKFFSSGLNGIDVTPEMARVILESQVEIYNAMSMAAEEAADVDTKILQGMKLLRENMKVTRELSQFVEHAHEAGVINGRETETITHPLQDHSRIFEKQMRRAMDGRTSHRQQQEADVSDLGDSSTITWSCASFSQIAHIAAEEEEKESKDIAARNSQDSREAPEIPLEQDGQSFNSASPAAPKISPEQEPASSGSAVVLDMPGMPASESEQANKTTPDSSTTTT